MNGFPQRGAALLRAFGRGVLSALVALGSMYLTVPEAGEAVARSRRGPGGPAHPPRCVLSGPPPGHPERLCPGLPLSPQERELLRELPSLRRRGTAR
ncbi:DUF6059 family protein [Streptomyces sp. NPDC053474]|uniref:DUF6059 family protein n=1 Tax=Streptomyces sp. NPDC053474 TaxID=3365704 RepID=UPI0037D168AE